MVLVGCVKHACREKKKQRQFHTKGKTAGTSSKEDLKKTKASNTRVPGKGGKWYQLHVGPKVSYLRARALSDGFQACGQNDKKKCVVLPG